MQPNDQDAKQSDFSMKNKHSTCVAKGQMTSGTTFLLLSLLLVSVVSSCNDSEHARASVSQQPHHTPMHQPHAHAFTDKSSVEKAAQRLESPQRDAMLQPQKIIQHLGNITGKTVLDIGAGTGYFSVKFAASGAHVIAAEVSAEMQAYLRQRMEKNAIGNIELRKTTYDNPSIKEGEVNIAFVADTYHHIDNRTDYFAKVKKGLATNGELVVVDYFAVELPREVTAPPAEMRVPIDQVVAELKKAGFTTFEVDANTLPYHYIITAK